MNYTFMPSLKYIALVRTAVMLWNEEDNRTTNLLVWALKEKERQTAWQAIEDRVQEKVSILLIPEELKEGLLNLIPPIGQEILNWRLYHEYFLCERRFIRRFLNRLCWTPQGTVDRKKTAELLITDENIDISRRYKLSCIYCLEHAIPKLWNQMPENLQKTFYNEDDPENVDQQELVVVWTYHIKGEVAKMENLIEKRWENKCSVNQYAFECAVHDGIKAATEYFLHKLTPKEREDLMVTSVGVAARRSFHWNSYHPDVPMGNYSDVVCFILSQMTEKQKTEVFERNHREVLKCLLGWPCQRFFQQTVDRMLEFLQQTDCNYILRDIADKLMSGNNDYDYRLLFRKFWRQIPSHHKKFILKECAIEVLLSKLQNVGDAESVRLILKDAAILAGDHLPLLKLQSMKLE